ncbi:MAG: outer membrane protein OmpA-like peptidoglycan-associated protein [Maribacter sp.]|jgi:outer membrane protein OmpA-like peptidoglycan-associated protein/tetratricopeptide (TPR) repeat protein
MRIFGCIFISMFLIGTLSAQSYVTKKTANKKALKFYMKGKELGRASDSAKALESFEKALKEEPTFIDAKIEWAGIKYVKGNTAATEKALEEVIGMDPYYNTKLLYTLAVIKKKTDNCKEAKKYYEQYINAPKAREVLLGKSKKGIEDCDFVLSQGNNIDYSNFDPKPISNNVNTKSREYFPSISADGETFFFTRVTRGQEDIYYCNKTDNGWGEAKPLTDINTTENEANQSISADGRVIIFTACNRQKTGYGSCDLYLSEFKNGAWTPVVNMGRAINSTAWESQPSLSADGNLLYFTSKRTGSVGKSDIYYSKRNVEGAWSVAKLVKGEINTKGEEQTPFIHQDGQTLYFKSTGHPGLGGYDIFYSRLQKDGTWGKPVNLSAPINSKYDEGNFVVSLDGKTAYFDSDKKMTDKGAGQANENLHDIYEIELNEKLRPFPVTYVKAKVVDAQTNEPLVAKVDFMNLGIQKRHAFNISNEKGEFIVCLPVGENYGLNVAKEGYLFYSDNFALDKGASTEEPYVLEIRLNPIPSAVAATPITTKPNPSNSKPTATILKNIFFASGSAVLKPESTGELLKLYDLLQTNPKMNIQINGHTDNVGGEPRNFMLSEKRAKAVYEYLIQKGITSNRLKYKGYGESQPIITNATIEGRQMNRRTEFIVL